MLRTHNNDSNNNMIRCAFVDKDANARDDGRRKFRVEFVRSPGVDVYCPRRCVYDVRPILNITMTIHDSRMRRFHFVSEPESARSLGKDII